MRQILMIRHGQTDWNQRGLLQGRTDTRLNDAGIAQVRSWSIPAPVNQRPVYSSPLKRATQTARLLFDQAPILDHRLVEMDWGSFEGKTLRDLRAEDPEAMRANEAKGIDFRPPGGERPRDVARRLQDFFDHTQDDLIIVTHKGVLHAAMILALDWAMLSKPPVRLARDTGLMLELDHGGGITAVEPWNLKA